MPELLERFQAALADSYAVESEIGRGGMAVVYLAEDLKHGRQVAIKVLHPELAASLGAERFLREIEIATKLVHPRILPIFDSGEADGFLFYVMPYIDGESLRDRLDREKQLPLEDALQIAQQVADVLGYAHDQGIVHRDIKPENILFEAGHAIVADFGIAKAVATAGGEKLTQTGLAVGTPAYMSPEQAGGEANLDGRADLYALGCVLYEMLAGDPPFTGATSQVILARKSMESVPSLRAARETVSEGVEAVIERALAKAPADRHPTARAFGEALRKPPQPEVSRARRRRALILAVSVLVVGAGWVILSTLRSASAEALPVVAVLPCENQSLDSGQDHVADRWANALIRNLFKTAGLRTRSLSTMQQYRGSDRSPSEIAAAVQAGYFLNCSVDETGGEVRLVADLVRTDDEELLWADEFRDELTVAGITSIQSRAVQAIAAAVGAAISSGELAQLNRLPTQSDSAYQLFLNGQHALSQGTAEGTVTAEAVAREAIAEDPAFAEAYALLADALMQSSYWKDAPPLDLVQEAQIAASRALELDSTLTMAAVRLADLSAANFQWDAAEARYTRVLELNPESVEAHIWFGAFLTVLGRGAEGVRHTAEAVRLDPVNLMARNVHAMALIANGRYEDGAVQAQEILKLNGNYPVAYGRLADALVRLEQKDSAVAVMKRGYALDPEPPLFKEWMADIYALAGRMEPARALLDTLLVLREQHWVAPSKIAIIYNDLGMADSAVSWFEQAYAVRDYDLAYFVLFVSPEVRSSPRFQALLRRMNLAP